MTKKQEKKIVKVYYKSKRWFALPESLKNAMWSVWKLYIETETKRTLVYRYWFKDTLKNKRVVWILYGTPYRAYVVDFNTYWKAYNGNLELIGYFKKEVSN